MNSFESARGFLQSMVSPLQYLATAPKQMMNWAAENIVTRRQLIADNEQYKINELVFHEQALQLDIVSVKMNDYELYLLRLCVLTLRKWSPKYLLLIVTLILIKW